MKILLVSHQLDFSGAPNALLAAARVLIGTGAEVDLLSLAEGPLAADFESVGTRRVHSTNFLNYDLVVLNTVLSARLAFSIPKKVKYLLWIHESPILFTHSDIPFIVSKAASGAAAIIFPSDSTATEWARYGSLRPDRSHVFNLLSPVSLPPSLTRGTERLRKYERGLTPFQIVTIDPVEYFRGHRTFGQSMQILSGQSLDFHYTAVGASREQIDSLFTSSERCRIVATGRVARSVVLEILSRSHLYISASAFATQNLGLCEASLLGIPAIVSDIPVHRAWAERMGGSVILSRLFEPEALARHILRVERSYENYRLVADDAKDLANDVLSDKRFERVFTGIVAFTTDSR
jgi:glycosyltransferase involved in cell wall biosynthesis